jgi:hypothetical protein
MVFWRKETGRKLGEDSSAMKRGQFTLKNEGNEREGGDRCASTNISPT